MGSDTMMKITIADPIPFRLLTGTPLVAEVNEETLVTEVSQEPIAEKMNDSDTPPGSVSGHAAMRKQYKHSPVLAAPCPDGCGWCCSLTSGC